MQRIFLITGTIISIILVLLVSLRINTFGELAAEADYAPVYAVTKFPRPTLLQTNTTIPELIARRKELHTNHISGVILDSLPSAWYDNEDSLNATTKECQKLNRSYTENYLVIRIIPPSLDNMPNWDDIEGWATINARIQTIVRFAKKTNFKGIMFDTTVTSPEFWCPEENPRYKDISDEFASKVIYQRSRELIQNISAIYPTLPIILAPAGVIAKQPAYSPYPHYQYWIHFANGLLSTRHPGGITFLATNYTDIQTTKDIEQKNITDMATLNTVLDEKQYWQDKGAISLLAAPGSTTENTTMRLRLLQKHSQAYVVIPDNLSPELVAPLYDSRLKSYYEYVCTEKKPLWINYHWRILLHNIKDRWHEII